MFILGLEYSCWISFYFLTPPAHAYSLSINMPSEVPSSFTLFWWIRKIHELFILLKNSSWILNSIDSILNLWKFIMFGCILTCCPQGGKNRTWQPRSIWQEGRLCLGCPVSFASSQEQGKPGVQQATAPAPGALTRCLKSPCSTFCSVFHRFFFSFPYCRLFCN